MKKRFWLICCMVIASTLQGDDTSLRHAFTLMQEKSFHFFDLPISEQEIDFLQSITISKFSNLNYFGALDLLSQEIVTFLMSLGNDASNSAAAAEIIHRMVLGWLKDLEYEACWVCMRAFKANSSYNMPRWHIDGVYYYQEVMELYKIACALKGASTIICDDFDGVNRYEWMKSSRAQLATLCQDSKIYSAGYGQGVVFVVGDKYRGTIHSEPAMPEDRLFLSIVPGTKQEIAELAKRWKNPK